MHKKFLLSMVLCGFVVLCQATTCLADVCGYVARADVQVPGQRTETWKITGVVNQPTLELCRIAARNEALRRLEAKGTILVGPTVHLCTPFVGSTETKEK